MHAKFNGFLSKVLINTPSPPPTLATVSMLEWVLFFVGDRERNSFFVILKREHVTKALEALLRFFSFTVKTVYE
jgi:hypothetical protein